MQRQNKNKSNNLKANYLEDEACWVEEDDIDDIIWRCDEVLNDHSLASRLLPTLGGFFFGSTDYDEFYFNDVEHVHTSFKHLKELAQEEGTRIVAYFRW